MKHESVQNYYGEVLQSSADLQTNACCTPDDMPDHVKKILSKIHDDVLTRYYGCGLIAPLDLEGMSILDLGCGAGRDVYALSAMVGETGRVVGVDMTPEQLEVARAHQDYHAQAFGHAKSNVEFHHGYIEKLDELDLEPGSFDIIVSNCVINLATDKDAVLRGAHRLLKEGGEMYFSDVYADRRIPQAMAEDEVLYGECLSGALYWNDFLSMARKAGFGDPRRETHRPLTIENPALEARVAPLKFLSATYRLFKLPALEPACEDYGQAVIYKGTVPNAPHEFVLDDHHIIETGKVFPVCGNTWMMLQDTRFARHFDFIGDFSTHYGIFEGCGGESPFEAVGETASSGGGCC
ncbi:MULTISPECIES: methyltransferase domain-containing protein [unclassified Ruegeria]|uniref:methyltransferase domain-containing protein n=1 Tax=unclassified Ruegeria TaxID=2625375 RepID=UPI001488340C|nr:MULTISPECIES: methyltransferase domain-containing protein [unclassified Ruegeria]NOD78021.1 methyltransferase domain-containing protein [Ruegeria sp. HKCCD4332]NOD87605.1 methyltransferase domain-containing protein [Ruegeria sp. HKCCD4318]NOE15638.1 methyltransferase domain-containing protein [Ruegeria sp. HKCCD4318-2]NOG08671.1 methyltransferase domain-containing protein [Ruegeria sp. HKCCD4315]